MRHILFLLLAGFGAGCHYTSNPVPVVVMPDSLYTLTDKGYELVWDMSSNAGVTLCGRNDTPVIFLSPRFVNHPAEGLILAHEREHVRQLNTHKGGCRKGLLDYTTNPDTRGRWEAEAHCASIFYARVFQPEALGYLENMKREMIARERITNPMTLQILQC